MNKNDESFFYVLKPFLKSKMKMVLSETFLHCFQEDEGSNPGEMKDCFVL